MRAGRLLKEPLIHFLVAGALIFAWSAWLGEPVDPSDRTITVDREQQAIIALGFERTMQRPPTDAELDGLIDRWVREEVLYREALRLGLDDGDPVVRRRLAKKMDFLAASEADLAQPSHEELASWYEANADKFSDAGTLTFAQRYFASEQAATAAIRSGATGQPSALPGEVADAPSGRIAAQFGKQFLDAVAALDASDDWQGPIQSGLGWHLVKLEEKSAGSVPPLASIRERVVAEWRLSQAAERREAAYRVLEDAYTVERAQ